MNKAVNYSFRRVFKKLPSAVKESLLAHFAQRVFEICADICYTEIYGDNNDNGTVIIEQE